MTVEEAVDLAIRNICLEGLTDIFRCPCELQYFKNAEAATKVFQRIVANLKKHNFKDLGCEYLSHVLVPKSSLQYDYRRAALLSPGCTISYLALTLLAAEKIEQKRIPVAQHVVFSYRFAPHGDQLFSDEGGYNKWREEIVRRRTSGRCRVVVKCDLAAFYDRVNLHRLQSTLESIGIERWISTTLNDLLLYWSRKDSYGLPIGGNASRILAEAVLIDIDDYLCSEGIEFVRYVDDFRLFAPNLVTAQKWLGMLTARLFGQGLLLNASKTHFYAATAVEREEVPAPDSAERILEDFIAKSGKYRTIPRLYKKPSTEKFEAFKIVDIPTEISNLEEAPIAEFSSIQKILIAILAKQEFTNLSKIDFFLMRCVYSVDYVIDMLQKNSQDIPEDVRRDITSNLERLLNSAFFRNLDWYEYKIICLLGTDPYFSKRALINYVRDATRETSPLSTLTALELLFDRVTRTDALTIREWYDRCGEWEKRRIMKIVASSMPTEEAKAWFRSIRANVGLNFITDVAYSLNTP